MSRKSGPKIMAWGSENRTTNIARSGLADLVRSRTDPTNPSPLQMTMIGRKFIQYCQFVCNRNDSASTIESRDGLFGLRQITTAMTEGEELTQHKSARRDRALRVHRIVLALFWHCLLLVSDSQANELTVMCARVPSKSNRSKSSLI